FARRESNLSRQWFLTSHTRANTATNGCMRGTGFHSTDGGRRGRHLPCQTCSNRIRMCRTIYRSNGGSISRWTHLFGSLNSLFMYVYANRPAHPLHPPQTCTLPAQHRATLVSAAPTLALGPAVPTLSSNPPSASCIPR